MKQKLGSDAKAKHIKVTEIIELDNMFVHVCPCCGRILASCVERGMMPEFSYCEHCIEDVKPLYIVHRTHQYGDGNVVMWLERTQAPTMAANILNDWMLSCGEFGNSIDVQEAAAIMREAQDWLIANKDFTKIIED